MRRFETLVYEVDGPIARATLNRPDILNRLDEKSTEELVHVVESLRRPGDVRVLILASTGRTFSAGGDLGEVLRLIEDYDARMLAWDMGRRLVHGMSQIAVPTIVALHGDVYGLAASVALAGDIVIASRNVLIGDPHVKIGLVAGDGGVLVWPEAIGMPLSRRHLLTGDPMDAAEVYRLGGISELVEAPENVMPLAKELAAKIATLPPIAVQYTKRALNHSMTRKALDVFEFSLALEQYSMTSDDAVEAISAFKEKREPHYRNR